MNLPLLGKWLALAGFCTLIFGLILWIFGKWIGKMPGDLSFHKEKVSIYFPVVSSLIISIALTILINFLIWLFRK